jgi:large subunit ribosomal protein L30
MASASKTIANTMGKTSSKPGSNTGGSSGRQVKVTLVRSVHGQLKNIAASVRGLGLRRPHQSVTVADTVENRGMIHAAGHLLRVESTTVEQN